MLKWNLSLRLISVNFFFPGHQPRQVLQCWVNERYPDWREHKRREMRSSLFWDVTLRRLVVTDVSGYPSVPSSNVKQSKMNLEDGTNRFFPKRRWLTTNHRCVTFYKSDDVNGGDFRDVDFLTVALPDAAASPSKFYWILIFSSKGFLCISLHSYCLHLSCISNSLQLPWIPHGL